MAGSRKRKAAERARAGLLSRVRAQLAHVVAPGERVTLALSGGIDSIVLLDLLARLAPRMHFHLRALHVDHQLSANSHAWARFCRGACRSLAVPCRVVRIEVARANSTERAAREARYAVLLRAHADHVVLAHNADDQAETVLLQLLRGAGVKGLAAMPSMRRPAPHGKGPSIVRPLIDVARVEIERYATRRKLHWVEDESNSDRAYTRNWLRHEVLPRIAARVPAYREALVRAAGSAAEAAALVEELGAIDAQHAIADGALRVEALRALSHARAKNLLRHLIGRCGWRMPDAAKLAEALRQVLSARPGRAVSVNLGSCEVRRHRGSIHLLPVAGAAMEQPAVIWRGERELELPALGGVLAMTRRRGAGLSAARLGSDKVTIRTRQGGERLQPDAQRPRRTVKNLLQEAAIPPWERERLPFIYCGETLACVPGIAIDWRFRAERGEPSIEPAWRTSQSRARAGARP